MQQVAQESPKKGGGAMPEAGLEQRVRWEEQAGCL